MEENLTSDQAMIALSEGKKLTHNYFTSSEWVTGDGCMYVFEDGIKCSPQEFWSIREDWPSSWRVIN